jgi:nucleoside-diphosphate-sugar epimerase
MWWTAGRSRFLAVLVALTGGTGFVGSHSTARLLDAGHTVRLLARDPAKVARVLGPLGIADDAVEVITGDMLDTAAVAVLLDGADGVVHAAAAIGVTGGGTLLEGNVAGTRNVVGGAAAAGIDPIVHISTVAVFVPPDGPIITPDSRLASPRTDYGRSKFEAERFVRGLQDGGAPITVIYPGGVIGPGQPQLDAMMEGLVGALGAPMWPMPPGGVGIVDVRDVALVIARSVEAGNGARRFLMGGTFLRWGELADICDELTGVTCRRMPVPARVLTTLGSTIDLLKRVRPFDYPLTRDAAELMSTAVPTDDQPTLDALGVEPRPVRESLAEALTLLAAQGHLSAKAAGRLAPDA